MITIRVLGWFAFSIQAAFPLIAYRDHGPRWASGQLALSCVLYVKTALEYDR